MIDVWADWAGPPGVVDTPPRPRPVPVCRCCHGDRTVPTGDPQDEAPCPECDPLAAAEWRRGRRPY